MEILEALKYVTTSIKKWVDDNKVAKVSGKGLSTNDYTTADKQKVSSMPNDLVVDDGKLYLAQDGVPITDSVVTLPSSNISYDDLPSGEHVHENKNTLDRFGINYANTLPTFNNNTLATQGDIATRVAEHRQEVLQLVSSIPKFAVAVVDTLPETDISNSTIYLVKDNELEGNLYTEYIYINSTWECLGSQSVDGDLSNYAKRDEIPNNKELLEKFDYDLGSFDSVAFNGIPLANIFQIPFRVSQLTNDKKFITLDDLPENVINGFERIIEGVDDGVNKYKPQTKGWVDDASLDEDGVPHSSTVTYAAAVTPEIPIKGGVTYTVKPAPCAPSLDDRRKIRTYDSSGIALDYMTYIENEDGTATFTTPENSETLRITVYIAYFGGKLSENADDLETVIENFNSSFMLVEGTEAPEEYISCENHSYKLKDNVFIPDKSVSIESVSDEALPLFAKLAGKTIVNFGDNVFSNAHQSCDISTFLAKNTGATVYNCGFDDCKMTVHPTAEYNAFSMFNIANAILNDDFSLQENAVASTDVALSDAIKANFTGLKTIDFSKVDIVTIAYGVNDWNDSVSLDDEENFYNTTTVGGALRTSIESLLTAYPNLRIFVLSTTWQFWHDENNAYIEDSDARTNLIGLKLADYNTKLRKIASEYNIPFVDNYNIGINKFNRLQYFDTTDGTHHQAQGKKLIALHLAKELY